MFSILNPPPTNIITLDCHQFFQQYHPQAGLIWPHHSLSTSLLLATRCLGCNLFFPCPNAGISHFFKESQILSAENGIRSGNQVYTSLMVLIADRAKEYTLHIFYVYLLILKTMSHTELQFQHHKVQCNFLSFHVELQEGVGVIILPFIYINSFNSYNNLLIQENKFPTRCFTIPDTTVCISMFQENESFALSTSL